MLPDFRLERYFSRWEFRARWNLAASDAESMSIAELLAFGAAADREALHALRLGYIETTGMPALREAIAARYAPLEAADVLTLTGAEEGLFCAMHALLQSGDHAVVAVPNYQSTETIPRSICEVTGVPLRADHGWSLDPDELEDAMRPNTRLIAVNFPNNPTGAMASPDAFAEIVSVARRHGAYLLSDEAYRGLERGNVEPLVPAALAYERGLSLGVASKAMGLPGLRVGWMVSRDREVLARMERVKHYLSICGSAPSELLATLAVRAADPIMARNRTLADRNLERLRGFLCERADRFEWYRPEGGCVMFPRYRGPEGVEELCRRAVEKAGVILLPASVFQSELLPVATDRFRIGFGRRDFDDALEALARHLES